MTPRKHCKNLFFLKVTFKGKLGQFFVCLRFYLGVGKQLHRFRIQSHRECKSAAVHGLQHTRVPLPPSPKPNFHTYTGTRSGRGRWAKDNAAEHILIKNKFKFSSYLRKFRGDRMQSQLWLKASSYRVKYLRVSSYIGEPFLIYMHPIPSKFPYIWGKFYFLFRQCDKKNIFPETITYALVSSFYVKLVSKI